jgi:hypothetical protein
MVELPRLELTENPNKKNEYIIFRNQYKSTKSNKITKNRVYKKKHGTKKKRAKSNKGIFNIFYTFAHLKRRLNNEKNNTKMQKFD